MSSTELTQRMEKVKMRKKNVVQQICAVCIWFCIFGNFVIQPDLFMTLSPMCKFFLAVVVLEL